MDAATDFPSLMDDTEFLAELDKIEGVVPRRADRPSHAALATGFDQAEHSAPCASTRPLPNTVNDVESPAALEALLLPPGADRWQTTGKPLDEADARPATVVPAFLTILFGLSAGAVSSALLFHDRVAWLLQFWSR